MRVGFVGLGNMGTHMCTKLLEANYIVQAYDLREEAVEQVVEEGAYPAQSSADAAKDVEVLITMLPDPEAIEAVMLGPGGAGETLKPGSAWIDMSTSDPEMTDSIIDQAGLDSRSVLDATVSGGVKGAQDGTIQIFVGADGADFERYLPVLEAMGDPQRIFHVGGRGAGYVVKLCVNLLWFIHAAASAEVLTLGINAGVDLQVLRQALISSPAQSHFVEHDLLRVFEGDYKGEFPLGLVTKDLRLAVSLGRKVGVPMEVSALVEQIHQRARLQYGNRGGEMLALKLLEDLTHAPLRPQSDA